MLDVRHAYANLNNNDTLRRSKAVGVTTAAYNINDQTLFPRHLEAAA